MSEGMQSVTWSTFCVANAVARTVVHFFPSSGTVTAPYPAQCKFSLFKQGELAKSVSIDGLRLSQPDGVRLEDVFPFLREGVDGLLGLHVTLSTVQPRIDLSPSACVIEIATRSHSVRFRAMQVGNGKDPVKPSSPGLVIDDSFQSCSLVVVNGGGQALEVPAEWIDAKAAEVAGEASPSASPSPSLQRRPKSCSALGALNPWEVGEYQLRTEVNERVESTEHSWGSTRLAGLGFDGELPAGASCYMMYRDAKTNLPVSVTTFKRERRR